MKTKTKDELLLIELAKSCDMQKDVPLDPIQVAQSIGISRKACSTIVNTLAKANFIKKLPDDRIFLTTNGLNLIAQLSP